MTDDATRAQNAAADPRFSTWLSANAGSGKTRVLTDRVARLLLAGTEPQNILCLTYTKAAASEMQNRLFRRLGEWAMLDDAELRKQLAELDEEMPDDLARARTLFARAIETPGGLKIQTIHSFCSSVLRPFPLEAGVSPQFRELDDAGQKDLIERVIDGLATADDPSLAEVGRIFSSESLGDLAKDIAGKRQHFSPPWPRDTIFRHFGAPPDLQMSDLVSSVIGPGDLAHLRDAGRVLQTSDKSTDQQLGAALSGLSDLASERTLTILEPKLLYQSGAKAGQARTDKPTKDFRNGPFQPYVDHFQTIMERLEAARPVRIALEAATKTAALHDFAKSFLPAYAAAKQDAGALDFDDLIQKTAALFQDRSLQWVLYRLDGGIEHILVDEAQDTSPSQWSVIDALASEITAGDSADRHRTLFVVGDKKQSIYSFQGADAEAFDRMRRLFAERLGHGDGLQSRELHYSFRSSSAILDTVDRVFEADAGRGLGQDIQHRAFHADLPGRVDLWPLEMAPEVEDTPAWYDPVDRIAANDPRVTLSRKLAKTIKGLIGTEAIPGEKGVPRKIRAGDFLILVQGRGALFDHIIRACKEAGIAMAGADRLKIGGELAVRDLLALLSFLALQEDDLSLAAALRSPLFGWTEKQLYDLAQGRAQPYLWAELRDRREDFPETFAALTDLLRQVDFLRPFEMLEFILTRQEGRRKLLARLGPEAEDGIDELLNQALAFESEEVPSLTGFLTRARSEEVEIKRPSDATGDLLRVMTVHGAKGLEAPIVILPDTNRAERARSDTVLLTDSLPVWRMSKDNCPEVLDSAREADERANREERQRLLYVAMTRAETWLIVCGVQNRQNPRTNWYADVRAAVENMQPLSIETPTGQGLRIGHADWPQSIAVETRKTVTDQGVLPDFLRQAAEKPPAQIPVLSPSDLGGDKTAGGGAAAEEAARRYGRQMHRLLELLPRADRSVDAAQRILQGGPDPFVGVDAGRMRDEALGVIAAYPELFAPDTLAEVDVTGAPPSLDARISGTIDRLVIAPDRITAADFKTNAVVSDRPEDVPEGILRQMGAYLEALEQIYPGRRIALRVVWTATSTHTDLPHGIVREALARTTTS